MCQSFFFDKVAGLKPVTLLKKGPWHRCFPVNFAKFLRTLSFNQLKIKNIFLVLMLSLVFGKFSIPIIFASLLT